MENTFFMNIKAIDSDLFLEMPLSAQALYFHLAIQADTMGKVKNPKKILRGIRASVHDLELLASKNFVTLHESGSLAVRYGS